MSVQKKSLISNRVAVKKALIASQPSESGEANPLTADSLTAQSMKSKRANHLAYKAFKSTAFRATTFKAKK
jgi:hypothetical protein